MQLYSAALVLMGVSYKMFLYEYVYEDAEQEEGTHRLLFPVPRRLAGGGANLEYATDDRQQRIAYFFSGCMTVGWIASDLMLLAHRGIKGSMDRCYCEQTHKARTLAIMLIVARIGMMAFIATVCLYVTDPLILPVIGLRCLFSGVVLRVISSLVFPDDGVHSEVDEHGNHVEVEDDEDENKWPNETQAQAVPGKKVDAEDVTTASEAQPRDIHRRKSDYQAASDECYCVG
jgi:hypothetical protein